MNDLYDINYKFNGRFCKIRICYSVIHNWFTMDHLKKWYILEFAYKMMANTTSSNMFGHFDRYGLLRMEI
jgi:hypothetical protein